MIYKTLHRKQKIEQHEPMKIFLAWDMHINAPSLGHAHKWIGVKLVKGLFYFTFINLPVRLVTFVFLAIIEFYIFPCVW